MFDSSKRSIDSSPTAGAIRVVLPSCIKRIDLIFSMNSGVPSRCDPSPFAVPIEITKPSRPANFRSSREGQTCGLDAAREQKYFHYVPAQIALWIAEQKSSL